MASSVSVDGTFCPSVCRSLLMSVACLHIAIFSVRDSRDDAYEMRLSLIAAHMQRRVFHTHTHAHTSVLAAIVSTLDALRDWSSVCISITERDNWSRAPIEIYMCSPRLPIPRLPYNHTVPYPTLPCPTLGEPHPVELLPCGFCIELVIWLRRRRWASDPKRHSRFKTMLTNPLQLWTRYAYFPGTVRTRMCPESHVPAALSRILYPARSILPSFLRMQSEAHPTCN